MKFGDLERTHQVRRILTDPREGTSAGPDSWLWCTRCGDVLPTDPWEPGSCGCENVRQDYGRLVVDDWSEVVELATSSLPSSN